MSSSFEKNKYWKSISDYNNSPESIKAKHDEFLEGVVDNFDSSKLSGMSRRKFLAVLSSSAALATTACSDYRDKGEIIPYNKRPEEILPGEANYYASTCTACSLACGILIKTREGRPIKIDGNPDHPVNKGKICAKGQSNILSLYDPERLKEPKFGNQTISWEEADFKVIEALNNAVKYNKQIVIFTDKIFSPTLKKLLNDFSVKYPTTKVYSYSLVNDKNKRDAWFESYGSYEIPSVKWNEAEIILSLDFDFLGNEGNFVENMRLFSEKREVVKKLDVNRLYVAEGRFSATGMMADYRLRISPNQQLEFIYAIINELSDAKVISVDTAVKNLVSKYSVEKFGSKEKINNLLKDLSQHKGKSIIQAGESLSKDVHIAVNYLNELLGNNNLYDWENLDSYYQIASAKEIEELIDDMNSEKVDVLIHLNSNPVFNLPQSFKYKEALKKVKNVITLTEAENETSYSSNITLPINHILESWGDAFNKTNVYSTLQPVINPIFNTRQKESILLSWINQKYDVNDFRLYLINNFNELIYNKLKPLTDQKTFWQTTLHDGVVKFEGDSTPKKFNTSSLSKLNNTNNKESFTLHLTESYYIGDGKFANNGWLQETPHPVTKVTWDNYAAISPKLAKKLNVEINDLVEITHNNQKVILPVMVQPGMSDNIIHTELGYGRSIIGEVGKDVGVNVIPLISKDLSLIVENVSVKKVDGKYQLVSTQEHHSLDDTFVKDLHRVRKIIQEGTVEEYKKNPKFLHEEKHELVSITREHEYKGNKWAMAIDLNKCTSCSACITSCNVENNIPVVGKDQVAVGREMQWMRIDRYYSGTPEEPIVSNQPMLCQHCDNAPCENVCPVNATNHSEDGLNQMVYNRCVGTRYCSNNCPYKVRRYNFFNFRDHFEDSYYENNLTAMVHNPEVTVRSRGVMEKCTFCVQRIMEARSNAIRDGKPLNGNDIKTACQVACPTNAISFGDANDINSEVAKLRKHDLSYHVLEELNVKPNVTYIAKLRNTHSEGVI
ncbi:MAG: TAT-variant-translocated molybdopterin oxidoreductase [Melioribacteraceae bacterium]|nr:TAT-variant-translocated molybdopterin oxidoreductase [Melioribacteraceae bacterium]